MLMPRPHTAIPLLLAAALSVSPPCHHPPQQLPLSPCNDSPTPQAFSSTHSYGTPKELCISKAKSKLHNNINSSLRGWHPMAVAQ
jgi:hypothetical protein